MTDRDEKSEGIKSAYEAALERLEQQGIEKPREDGLDSETQDRIAEVRRTYEAKLAEIEILFQDRSKLPMDPADQKSAQDNYLAERSRLEQKRDREISKLRTSE